ncbi:MAG: hypothetical protein KC656_00675 [Myxococcales bacterium]|nr:hypothetical protein [Myxococcales bacterium]MCB9669644.1 hypothetical protein [Alphaproteobacteria bacterium]MCB9672771.1 hypothetical protein [Alphaproteobacteria bacterium]
MDLAAHIESSGTIADIAAHLANLAPDARWASLAALQKRHQRTLWLKAEASRPVEAGDLVEGDQPVVHRGKNSLPLFRDFEKRFVREGDRIWGYNEGRTRRFLGPGYFLARPTGAEESARAAWLVDYFQVPAAPPCPGWPEVRGNGRGLSFFVYHHTRDYLRVVGDGVLIGSAHRVVLGRERRLDSYFLLHRT